MKWIDLTNCHKQRNSTISETIGRTGKIGGKGEGTDNHPSSKLRGYQQASQLRIFKKPRVWTSKYEGKTSKPAWDSEQLPNSEAIPKKDKKPPMPSSFVVITRLTTENRLKRDTGRQGASQPKLPRADQWHPNQFNEDEA